MAKILRAIGQAAIRELNRQELFEESVKLYNIHVADNSILITFR